ncbi:hypothetical protein HFTV1-gp47 [Haloferax tailed virus 1]|uniref:Uncharacterized protein n=1 Tax=Haloferax tailed virus 1 TaxID=2507575 RepID=A0A410N6X0_HFTV1|nr:hypothetical protein M1M17_gp47 [Haloferax tailed virus 1]QAS68880.1 hypothetical protein HFTV1-gp47 [Haloferax tailed virus 1]
MSEHKVDEPIGGENRVIGKSEQDYYDKEKGDFRTRELAKVRTGSGVSINDSGMVVDLLNDYDAKEIRRAVIRE